MDLLHRIRRLTLARIESYLNSIEDAAVLLPQLLRELEALAAAAAKREAKALAAATHTDRARRDTESQVERMSGLAEAAMVRGDETVAREALRAQVDAEQSLRRKLAAQALAHDLLNTAREAHDAVRQRIGMLRERRREMLTAGAPVDTQCIPAPDAAGLLDAVARFEATAGEGTHAGIPPAERLLESRLAELEQDTLLESRLKALKSRHRAGNAGKRG